MPVISRFYGILIAMYFLDHNPPHIHAKYSGYEALFDFNGNMIEGFLPKRAVKLVQEWVFCNRPALEENWQRAMAGEPLKSIEPLE